MTTKEDNQRCMYCGFVPCECRTENTIANNTLESDIWDLVLEVDERHMKGKEKEE